ncbi:hypothetical protein QQ045_033197 [Rhodiola kirilowii]
MDARRDPRPSHAEASNEQASARPKRAYKCSICGVVDMPRRGRSEAIPDVPSPAESSDKDGTFLPDVTHLLHPGPISRTLLYKQDTHRSKMIWETPDTDDVLTIRHRGIDWPERRASGHGITCIIYEVDWSFMTALVERWRSETHTFHLRKGEMTITLEDVGILTGLPIEGRAVTTQQELLGVIPHGKRLTTVRRTWLREHMQNMPADATDVEIQRYARAYILAMLGSSLFPDSSGSEISLHFLPLLADLDSISSYSWGGAVLANLYRNMWNVPKSYMHTSHHVLMLYRDLLDRQEANDVVWAPYTDAILAPLNPICLAGRESWRAEVPLICFHIAEWHYPSRVLRQFGWGQPEPALPPASHKEMHRHIRRTTHLVDDVMQGYIHLWDNRAAHIVTGEADTDGSYLEPYYAWYSTVTRKRIQPPLNTPEPYRPSGHEHYLLVSSLVRTCKMSANMFFKTTDKECKGQLHDMFHAARADLLKIGEGRALDVDVTQIQLRSDSDEDIDLSHDSFDVGPSQVTQAESQRSPSRRVSTRARKTTQRFTTAVYR